MESTVSRRGDKDCSISAVISSSLYCIERSFIRFSCSLERGIVSFLIVIVVKKLLLSMVCLFIITDFINDIDTWNRQKIAQTLGPWKIAANSGFAVVFFYFLNLSHFPSFLFLQNFFIFLIFFTKNPLFCLFFLTFPLYFHISNMKKEMKEKHEIWKNFQKNEKKWCFLQAFLLFFHIS